VCGNTGFHRHCECCYCSNLTKTIVCLWTVVEPSHTTVHENPFSISYVLTPWHMDRQTKRIL